MRGMWPRHETRAFHAGHAATLHNPLSLSLSSSAFFRPFVNLFTPPSFLHLRADFPDVDSRYIINSFRDPLSPLRREFSPRKLDRITIHPLPPPLEYAAKQIRFRCKCRGESRHR